MVPIDNGDLSRDNSVKWILENAEIDTTSDVQDNRHGANGLQEPANQKSFTRNFSISRRRNGVVPRMGRMESGATRGLKSLRFLDRSTTGSELCDHTHLKS